MNLSGQNQPESFEGSPEEERLGELINDYFDRLQVGEKLTVDAFLAEHPQQADELRQHFGGLSLLAALKSPTEGAGSSPSGGRKSSDENGLNLQNAPLPEVPGYEILKQIGRGGMGIVFKAIQNSTKRIVALKLLLEGALAAEATRRRFEREIALAARLNHPNIIPIYDSGTIDGRMYYAMEYVHGQSLGDYLKSHSRDRSEKLRLFIKMGQAISHAHQRGVVHRDLKPTNVLVDAEHEPHLLDFGLAKAGLLLDNTTSVTAQIIGTPAYMSPEQAAGDPSAIDTRTDVYSLGVILYEMMTGRMPYDTSSAIGTVLHHVAHTEPTPPTRIDPKIDAELSAIILKALEKSKDRRYQSVDALCGDVQRYLSGEPITARPAGGLYLLWKFIRNNRPVTVIVALVLLFGAITGDYARRINRTQEQVRQLKDQVSELQPDTGAGALGPGRSTGHKGGEPSRRELEWFMKNADPEVVKILGPMARELNESVDKGEDPRMALIRLLVGTMAELTPGSGASEARKTGPDDLAPPNYSPRPTETPEETAPTNRGLLDANKLAPLLRALQQVINPPANATQPSAEPTTQKLAETVPTTQNMRE